MRGGLLVFAGGAELELFELAVLIQAVVVSAWKCSSERLLPSGYSLSLKPPTFSSASIAGPCQASASICSLAAALNSLMAPDTTATPNFVSASASFCAASPTSAADSARAAAGPASSSAAIRLRARQACFMKKLYHGAAAKGRYRGRC